MEEEGSSRKGEGMSQPRQVNSERKRGRTAGRGTQSTDYPTAMGSLYSDSMSFVGRHSQLIRCTRELTWRSPTIACFKLKL